MSSEPDDRANITTRAAVSSTSRKRKPVATPVENASIAAMLKSHQATFVRHPLAPSSSRAAQAPRQPALHLPLDSRHTAALAEAPTLSRQPGLADQLQPLGIDTKRAVLQRQAPAQPSAFQQRSNQAKGDAGANSSLPRVQPQSSIAVQKDGQMSAAAPLSPEMWQLKPGGEAVAARLHALQAQTLSKTWQQQQQQPLEQQLPPIKQQVVFSESRRSLTAKPAAGTATSAPYVAEISSNTSGSMQIFTASGLERGPFVTGGLQQPARAANSSTVQMAAMAVQRSDTGLDRRPLAPVTLGLQQPARAVSSSAMQTAATAVQHSDALQTGSMWPADLSAETESLVNKLRALSQGRDAALDHSKGKVVQQQSFPYKAKAGKRGRSETVQVSQSNASRAPPDMLTSSSVQAAAIQRVAAVQSAAAASHAGKHSHHAPSKHQPQTAAALSRAPAPSVPVMPFQDPHQPEAASLRFNKDATDEYRPAAMTKGSHAQSSQHSEAGLCSDQSAQPVPSNGRTAGLQDRSSAPPAAADDLCQQLQEAAAPQRQGKATPLRGCFTPRPSRFRLEAERITPHRELEDLQQALFHSPVKQQDFIAADADQAVPMETSNTEAARSSSLAEQTEQTQVEADPVQTQSTSRAESFSEAAGAGLSSCATPAATPSVFSHMSFILDPEFLSEQRQRYLSPAQL